MTIMFAQAVAEYGAMASMIAAAQRTFSGAGDWVLSQGPGTWIALGAVVVVWLVFSRVRNSRL